VLGDMLELGQAGAELHRAIAEQVTEYGIDLVFCAGPLMAALWEALPANRRGAHAAIAEDLELTVLGAVRGGDALMVKGSNGSRMGPIVKSLTRRYAPRQARDDVPAQG
jgi:UDP-N-acetylmuramoyl-tripeptide--D-alanyl-D-alanine ligase